MAGLPDLDRFATDAVLKDGQTIHIRPIRPDDLDAMMEMWSRLSPETIRLRFFAPRKMDREQMRYFTEVDHDWRVAVVAEHSGRIAGVGRFDRLQENPRTAEFAILVEDAEQGRGLGTALLRALLDPARELGVTSFHGDVLSENRTMLRVLRDAGLSPELRETGGVVETVFTTTPGEEYLRTTDRQDARSAIAALSGVFRPSSVAVVGASRDRRTIGGLVFTHLLLGGFDGAVYPVNPHASHVQSVAAYPTLADCPTVPDLAVVAVPAPLVNDVVDQAGRVGVRAAVIISAGFGEAGEEGQAREDELVRIARSHGIRLVGPNCMGVLNAAADVRLNATFSTVFPPPGSVAFSSQSGALGLAILAAADRLGLGLSSFASVGNKTDISGNDLIQYWEDDPATQVILLYLESFGNPRKFARIARRVGRSKPLVAVKSGRSSAGERAATSHTGALAAGDVAVDALFRQTGVVRVDTLEEMFHVASVLANQPLPGGRRIAILTNGGGPGILAADACEANGLVVPELTEETRARIAEVLPAEAGTANPVDMIASATAENYGRIARILAADDHVDVLLVIFVPPVVTDPEEVADAIAGAAADIDVPVVSVFMSETETPRALTDAHVPTFAFPEAAAKALGSVTRYSAWRRSPLGNVVELDDADIGQARRIVDAALADTDSSWLGPRQTDELLAAFGITTARHRLVADAEEAAEAQRSLAVPVVVKLAAPIHKTDVGAVRLGLNRPAQVADAVRSMSRSLRARGMGEALAQGWIVQEMVREGVEMVVGVQHDPSFGPLLMVGMGGTLVELLRDVSVRVHPLTDVDVDEMLQSLRGYPLLEGYRGSEPVDVGALTRLLFRVSAMVEAVPEVAEMDANPVFVMRRGVAAVDVRLRLRRPARRRRPGAVSG